MNHEVKTLDKVCELIVDCLHKTAPIEDSGYPLIRTPNIGRGRFELDGVHRVSEDTYKVWTQRAVPKENDIILAREAPAGNAAIIKGEQKLCLGQRTVLLRPDELQVVPPYLAYLLLAPKQQAFLLGNSTGVTVEHVNMSDIRRLPLRNLPPLQTQRKIAAILSAYDDLIENNLKRIRLLEESARLIFREWFVRLRFPGHEHTRITDGVPESWKRRQIKDIADVITGKTPSTKESDNFGGDILFVKTPDMHGKVFILETETCLTERGASTQAKKFIPAGSIMVSCIGTVGIVAVNPFRCQTNQQINSVIPNTEEHRWFCYYALQELKPKMKAIGGGVTMDNINKAKFESLEVLLPSETLLKAFDESVKSSFAQILNLQTQNQKLKQARDLLLPRLMSGDLPV